MAKRKTQTVYNICHPKAFHFYSAWIIGWYAGEENGNPVFSLYDHVVSFRTIEDAQEVLKKLPECCFITSGVRRINERR